MAQHHDTTRQTGAGVTAAGEGLGGTVWDILGQSYRPVARTDGAFAFDTLFPPGTFVPPHVHPEQDEFIRVLKGRFDLVLDGRELRAGPGDLVCMPRGSVHGIFNKSGAEVRALFWVSPAGTLFDLFTRLDGLTDPAEVVRISAEHGVTFLPPPA